LLKVVYAFPRIGGSRGRKSQQAALKCFKQWGGWLGWGKCRLEAGASRVSELRLAGGGGGMSPPSSHG